MTDQHNEYRYCVSGSTIGTAGTARSSLRDPEWRDSSDFSEESKHADLVDGKQLESGQKAS